MRQFACDTDILVIDIGNTNIVCGLYRQETLVWTARFKSSKERTADEYYSLLLPLVKDCSLDEIRHIAIGSVVPELSRIWLHLFQKYMKAKVYEINAYSPLGLSYLVSDPGFIGADLIANSFGAWKKYQTNCIVIDLGTATTIQVVTSSGLFMGSTIAPGLRTGAAFLFEKAALLSEIELISPKVLLGTNTRDALLSGIVSGHAFKIEAFISQIKSTYKDLTPLKTIMTGGIADLIKPLTPSVDIIDKTLTLDGLFLAARICIN